MNSNVQVDEFGRDPLLRKKKEIDYFIDYIEMISIKLEKMSWAELCYEQEEEEEKAILLEQQKQNNLLVKHRKILLAKGEYLLEEGEILE